MKNTDGNQNKYVNLRRHCETAEESFESIYVSEV